MRKENEIYCSNCGTLINLQAKFCIKCGFNQVEFPIASNNEDKLNNEVNNLKNEFSADDTKIELKNSKKEIQDNSTKIIGVLLFFLVLGVLYLILPTHSNTLKTTEKSIIGNEKSAECTGPGNENCINNVRKRFNDVGQTIIGEVHKGNGEFEITFMDRNRPGAYISNISTNCDCVISNVSVSTIR
jgi:hypothetical protein